MSAPRASGSLSLAPSLRRTGQSRRLLPLSSCWVAFTTSESIRFVNDYTPLIVDIRFVSVTPLYAPVSTGESDNIFITRSYDATSHFETVVEDVQNVWKRVVGKDLVLKKREDVAVEQ